MRHSFGAGCALFLVVFAGCTAQPSREQSSAERSLGKTSQAIQSGDPDGTDHPFAVGVCGGQKGNCSGYCSGALILPNLVVTARHCVSQSPREIPCNVSPPIRFGGLSYGQYWITTDPNMRQSTDGWHSVKSIKIPTGPDEDIFCGNDIALLILNDLVPDSEARPIIPNIQYSMIDPKFKRSFTAVGYGSTGPNLQDFGTRRILGKIPIRCIAGDPLIPCPTGNPSFPENEFIAGSGTCGGDSGSSAFEQSSFETANAAKAVSFGVLSRGGESKDGTACIGSTYTRLDKWRDLIIQAAQTASQNWTLYPKPTPDWTGPFVPPPPPDDGGTEDGGTKPVAQKPNGEACGANNECQSAMCVDGVCVQACNPADGASACPEGFECKENACIVKPAGTADPGVTTTTTTTSGCSAAPGRTSGASSTAAAGNGLAGAGLAAAAAVLVGLARARRRDRRS